MSVRGECLCGLVEFEVDLPFHKFVKCYCSRCRSATGSAFAANAYVSPAAFRWLSGKDNVARFDLSNARSFSTSFCRGCGSPLPHATRSGARNHHPRRIAAKRSRGIAHCRLMLGITCPLAFRCNQSPDRCMKPTWCRLSSYGQAPSAGKIRSIGPR